MLWKRNSCDRALSLPPHIYGLGLLQEFLLLDSCLVFLELPVDLQKIPLVFLQTIRELLDPFCHCLYKLDFMLRTDIFPPDKPTAYNHPSLLQTLQALLITALAYMDEQKHHHVLVNRLHPRVLAHMSTDEDVENLIFAQQERNVVLERSTRSLL